MPEPHPPQQEPRERRPPPAVSAILPAGGLAELVLDPSENRTRFAVFEAGAVSYEPAIRVDGERFVPYSASNNLLRHGVVLFPSGADEYESDVVLIETVRAFIHRYVALTDVFETIAAYYVLLTWIYDDFHEVPYLRVRGDAGSGKTRFLLAVGSLCYKPIFASGASTASPLFRIIDAFRGTLVLDEGDFRFSDEKAEIVKILNNGNAKGFPVLRSEVMRTGEVNPTAYAVFGPKIIATRGFFEDRALESRCITEELGQYPFRKDVPISVPGEMAMEALGLRNRLLAWRFRNHGKRRPVPGSTGHSLEPRLAQVFAPLLAVIDDPEVRKAVFDVADGMHRDLVADRGLDLEAHVLQVIHDLLASGASLGIAEIARLFSTRFADDYDRPVTPKWLGFVVRRKLRLRTEKRHGVFVIAAGERLKLDQLFEKYGLGGGPFQKDGDTSVQATTVGDFGDIAPGELPPRAV
jgi:hypothetical protein